MSYTFATLSHIDFEDLVRDLLGQALGVQFEGFAPGPDGGTDGRHSTGGNSTILQAKHYVGSTFASLNAAMKKSRPQIDQLKPSRYLVVTSRPLSPDNKAVLAETIGPWLKEQSDILGPTELNALLRKFPDIEKANIKLWLSTTAVLDRVVHASSETFIAITREEIEAKLKVYAPNPSFAEARDKLETGHVVIISGPPGVGKTTLAEMLSYAYIGESWNYIAIRSLDDGYAKLSDTKKQIFFFDDFLGTAALDKRSLAAKDSDLARFMRRVRSSPNARFVLTTRAPIFEEARRVSEHLADKRLDILKYVLDVGIYTRRIKARILYNHLDVSGVSLLHIKALWESGAIPKIVDHRNYNPRIIEAMTDGLQIRDIVPEDYAAEFIKALNNPQRIWDVSFRQHIPDKCRHLLFALFFCSDFGVRLDELRTVFDGLHQYISTKYSVPHGPRDFEEALRILEGGYIDISNKRVSFINPSLRDYLTEYIDDLQMVLDFATAAQKAEWAERVWEHIRYEKLWSPAKQKQVAQAFIVIAQRFPELPVMSPERDDATVLYLADLETSARIDLLLEWSACSENSAFADIALNIATKSIGDFSPWRDGRRLVELLAQFDDDGYEMGLHYNAIQLKEALESGLVALLEGWLPLDDMEGIYESIEEKSRYALSARVVEAADNALRDQIDRVDSIIEDEGSESTLGDHIKLIKKFAPRLGVSDEKVQRAVSRIESRIGDLQEETSEASAPQLSANSKRDADNFDDNALENLFAPLVNGFT